MMFVFCFAFNSVGFAVSGGLNKVVCGSVDFFSRCSLLSFFIFNLISFDPLTLSKRVLLPFYFL